MTIEIERYDATAQADLVRKKEVTPRELVEASIARIERLNPTLNAVNQPLFEMARAGADGAIPDGPFRGVPYLVKDLFAGIAGTPMASGSRSMVGFVSPHDSELVARLRRAGFLFVGKTATPEFGILPTTEPHAFGATKNPWDPTRTPGGSSGGSAAAVAAGFTGAAHASDGGGSIRIPASCCGLFGLKPTRARITLGPDIGDLMSGLAVEHAVTRSVRDSAAILDATHGPSPGDPYVAPPPARPFLKEVGADPGKLRIAVTTTSFTGAPVSDECKRAVTETAKLCESLGHHVTEAAPTVDGMMLTEAFLALWNAGAAATVRGMALMTGRPVDQSNVEPLTWALSQAGARVKGSDYLIAVAMLQNMGRQIARFMHDYDLLLTPTTSERAPTLGSFDGPADNPMHGMMRAGFFCPFTPVANATGQPAMSLPLFTGDDGFPLGSHFIGRFGDEATLLRLAAQLEAARPWIGRKPQIA
jgi:amidase